MRLSSEDADLAIVDGWQHPRGGTDRAAAIKDTQSG